MDGRCFRLQSAEQIKAVKDELRHLALDYDRLLHEQRTDAYQRLWTALEPLALYFRERPATYESLLQLGKAMRHWYFQYGVYLTEQGWDRYFFLQDILQTIVRRNEGRL